MIRTLGALVGAAERADQLAAGYESALPASQRRRGLRPNQKSILRSGTIR